MCVCVLDLISVGAIKSWRALLNFAVAIISPAAAVGTRRSAPHHDDHVKKVKLCRNDYQRRFLCNEQFSSSFFFVRDGKAILCVCVCVLGTVHADENTKIDWPLFFHYP